MPSMSTFSAAAVLALAAATAPSAYATTTTTTQVPVNLNQNIVTIVLILGVAISVTLIFALAKLIPKIRSGEVSLSKIEFDWRAELLNQTPKKEKLRRAEEKARRDEERAVAGVDAVEFTEHGTQHYRDTEPLSPHGAAVASATTSEKRVHVNVFPAEGNRETR